jgi:hypothetical protein
MSTPQNEMEKAYEMSDQANDYILQVWLDHIVFSWQWWVQLSLTVFPWVIWILLRKKKSSDRLLYAGLFSMITASWLDTFGVALGLWSYKWEVIPIIPSFVPWNLSLLPVALMFALQLNPLKLNRYFKGVVFSAISSFLVEPFFVWIDFYHPERWNYIYSFPIVLSIYLIADYISRRTDFEKI